MARTPNPTKATRARIYLRDGYRCVYRYESGKRCRVSATEVYPGVWDTTALTIEHIIPKSAGGTNADKNLETMCKQHNQEMNTRFMKQLGRVVRRTPKEPILFLDVAKGAWRLEEAVLQDEELRRR